MTDRGETGATGATGAVGPRARYGVAGFLILMTFTFFGFVRVDQQTNAINEQAIDNAHFAEAVTLSLRAGCERMNVLRDNQARVLREQINLSEATLKRGLGAVEPLREEVKEGIRFRRAALRQLRESVKEHPAKDRPYHIDCPAAYP